MRIREDYDMLDPKAILEQFLGSRVPGTDSTVAEGAGRLGDLVKANPTASGVIAAALLGTKSGRNLSGSALKAGGLAAIAGLGYTAYKSWQAGDPGDELQIPPTGSGFSADDPGNNDEFILALVRAMIAAARADGHIDDQEKQRIFQRLQSAGVGSETEAFIEGELAHPTDLDGIVASAQSESQKVELYTASRLTIDPDSRAERGYLDMLAGRLGLPDELIDQIDRTVSAAKS
jgi:uncharacterized membrane protein YebE (DUF533 family)